MASSQRNMTFFTILITCALASCPTVFGLGLPKLIISHLGDDLQSYECSGTDMPSVTSSPAILSIRRDKPTCGFLMKKETQYLAIQTDDLKLRINDTMLVKSVSQVDPHSIITGPPFYHGYILFDREYPQVEFNFAVQSNESMEARCIQAPKDARTAIPVNGDVNDEFRVLPLSAHNITLVFQKTVDNTILLEARGAKNGPLTDLLSADTKIDLDLIGNQTVLVRNSVTLKSCSGKFEDKTDASHEITGPDATQLKQPYICANIFSLVGDRHFEVDFDNFLDITDRDDELIIDDGVTQLKVTKSVAADYTKRVMVFNGKNLAVIYTSPQFLDAKHVPFKLTVRSVSSGGLVDKPGTISFPASGKARFVLKPQPDEYASLSLPAKFQLSGANMNISDGNGNQIILSDGMYLPPKIASNLIGAPMNIDVDIKKKLASIDFKPVKTSCDGIVSSPSGSISILNNNGTCDWIVSGKESSLNVDLNDMYPKGCITIRPLINAEPIFQKCDVKINEILPKFDVGTSHVQVTTNPQHSFRASVSPSSGSFVQAIESNSPQRNITSFGFPVDYSWSSKSNELTLNKAKQNAILSVAHLDLRSGEKLLVNKQVLMPRQFVGQDLDLPGKNMTISIQRPVSSQDFAYHKGFNLIVTDFDQIFEGTGNSGVVQVPKNSSNVLIRLTGAEDTRISYNVTFSSVSKDYVVQMYDSQVLYRQAITGDAQNHGTTTTNKLLIRYFSTKSQANLPEMNVQYKQVAINKTTDHACDGSTRYVPQELLCQGKSYCADGSDLHVVCKGGPTPKPDVEQVGVSGVTVFLMSVMMFTMGALVALYGPDTYRNLMTRFNPGQYSQFSSSE